MEVDKAQELIVFLIGISTLIAGILAIIKASKMNKREIKSTDLEIEQQEVDLVKTYRGIATETANEALEFQRRLKALEDKVESQDALINNQTSVIEKQNARLDEQDIEIEKLREELRNSTIYNEALINQLKESNIIPVDKTIVIQKYSQKNKDNDNGK